MIAYITALDGRGRDGDHGVDSDDFGVCDGECGES